MYRVLLKSLSTSSTKIITWRQWVMQWPPLLQPTMLM